MKQLKEQILNQIAITYWITGLPGSGKSTLAAAIEKKLLNNKYIVRVLDGDSIRSGLCCDLGTSDGSNRESIRRVAEVAKLFNDTGIIVLAPFISPFNEDRTLAKQIIGRDFFKEVYCQASVDACAFRKIMDGREVGADLEYQVPQDPDLILNTQVLDLDTCVGLFVSNCFVGRNL